MAVGCVLMHRQELQKEDSGNIRRLITEKSWWDTVDMTGLTINTTAAVGKTKSDNIIFRGSITASMCCMMRGTGICHTHLAVAAMPSCGMRDNATQSYAI